MIVGKKTGSGDEDEQVELLTNLLPGNNCGACGMAGCGAMAEALAKVRPCLKPALSSRAQMDESSKPWGSPTACKGPGKWRGSAAAAPAPSRPEGRTMKGCWTAGRLDLAGKGAARLRLRLLGPGHAAPGRAPLARSPWATTGLPKSTKGCARAAACAKPPAPRRDRRAGRVPGGVRPLRLDGSRQAGPLGLRSGLHRLRHLRAGLPRTPSRCWGTLACVDPDRCTACGKCVEKCPTDAMQKHPGGCRCRGGHRVVTRAKERILASPNVGATSGRPGKAAGSQGAKGMEKRAALGLLGGGGLPSPHWYQCGGLGRCCASRREAAVGRLSRAESIGFTMGTVVRVTAEGDRAEEAVAAVMAGAGPADARSLTASAPTVISRALNAAGGEWVEVSAEVLDAAGGGARWRSFRAALSIPPSRPSSICGGLSKSRKPGKGHRLHRWPATPPDPRELAGVLKRVGYRGVEIDRESGRVRLTVAGQAIDLGAVAKGYGATRRGPAAPRRRLAGADRPGRGRLRAGHPARRHAVAAGDPASRVQGKILASCVSATPPWPPRATTSAISNTKESAIRTSSIPGRAGPLKSWPASRWWPPAASGRTRCRRPAFVLG